MIATAVGIPVARIRKIVKKDYVILVHQWHLPSLFVSYRKVSEWLVKLEQLIRQCGTLAELLGWECRLRQEYKRFSYPKAWVKQLDMAWHRQQWQVVLDGANSSQTRFFALSTQDEISSGLIPSERN